jgi:hypothetical protein
VPGFSFANKFSPEGTAEFVIYFPASFQDVETLCGLFQPLRSWLISFVPAEHFVWIRNKALRDKNFFKCMIFSGWHWTKPPTHSRMVLI